MVMLRYAYPAGSGDEKCGDGCGLALYLFRAVDKHGRLIDFMLADRRNTKAARRFLDRGPIMVRSSG